MLNDTISFFIKVIGKNSVQFAGETTDFTLEKVKDLVKSVLTGTTSGLEFISNINFLPEDWKEGLRIATESLGESSNSANDGLNEAIRITKDAFDKALSAIDIANKHSIDFIYDNRVISSILGSSHNSVISFTEIKMSFRKDGIDISPDEAYLGYKNSGLKKVILFVPGLFTDESLYQNRYIKIDERENLSSGIADSYINYGYYPLFIRFNHGKHISDNGKELFKLISDFIKNEDYIQINIIGYSIGCLIIRSMLYYGRENNSYIGIRNIRKVVFISSPDGGSYLEKMGFWLGFLMESSAITALKIIGIIGNLRSDAIKDLSHGIIREEDWTQNNPILRYFQSKYYGELDAIDCYQFYSSFALENDKLQEWLGDGIVELPSLTYLQDKVFLKKDRTDLRSINIKGANHFTILQSGLLRRKLAEIFEIHS